MENLERSSKAASRGKPATLSQGDFVLVSREDFHEGDKLFLRWRGPRLIENYIMYYVYLVVDLRNGQLSSVHTTPLKIYSDSSLYENSILSHVLSS